MAPAALVDAEPDEGHLVAEDRLPVREIVFIGQKVRSGGEHRPRQPLDTCLLDDEEFRLWEEIMESENENALERHNDMFEDGFLIGYMTTKILTIRRAQSPAFSFS